MGPQIVGVTGRAQHGKDSVGDVLEKVAGFEKVRFADALRDAALVINPLVQPLSTTRLADIVHPYGWEYAKARYPEVRRFLQLLGTDVVRTCISDMAWVDLLDQRVFDGTEDNRMFVVCDVRFPNEVNWVHKNQGIVLKVVRPNFDNGLDVDHPSEAGIDTLPYDASVLNDGTLDDLVDEVADALVVARETREKVRNLEQ